MLEFLKNVQLQEVELPKAAPTGVKAPDKSSLRVWNTGRVLPNALFVKTYNLEFGTKEDNATTNGVDFWLGSKWGMIKHIQLPQEMLFAMLVPKAEPKVTLYSSTTYNEDLSPKGSVNDNKTSKGGKELVEMLKAEGSMTDHVDYIDISFTPTDLKSPTNAYVIPKVVSSGARKGDPTYVTRNIEDATVFAVTIDDVVKFSDNKIALIEAAKSEQGEPSVLSTHAITGSFLEGATASVVVTKEEISDIDVDAVMVDPNQLDLVEEIDKTVSESQDMAIDSASTDTSTDNATDFDTNFFTSVS